jgi:hypothetical protein
MREWLLAHYEVLKDFAGPVMGLLLGIVGTSKPIRFFDA